MPAAGGFDYRPWSEVLAAVVTADGRVDYEKLAAERSRLADFVAQLAATSPDTDPERFPTPSDALAYWINAYNAFVLAAVIEEYPIRSVWKTRDGQFFQRARHVAGGVAVSLDDVEHRILRGRYREPRIHFAINCASNGCPPMRPRAYEPAGLDDTLAAATRQFLASEWNCRVDRAAGKIFVSRLFKMYAEDFAGDADSTEEYREGVLRFVADHTGESLEDLRALEVVYNTYDWGLNDSNRDPHLRPITFHESVETYHEGDGALRELLLYDGNFCNRDCSWCTVFGSPRGWYREYGEGVLLEALRQVAPDGNLKFYGGEPTLHADGIIAAMRFLRERGFRGLFTIYSNGVRAAQLVRMLESDPKSEAVLNYSIYTGRDAEPLPDHARRRLEDWSVANPMRLFSGYKALYRAGAAAGVALEREREGAYHGHDGGCLLCFPVLRSTGELHACPFAVENPAPHFRLGAVGTPPSEVLASYREFRRWAREVLDPAARAAGITSCEMCEKRVAELPIPRYGA
ncbi:MAG TPA: DUF547 domain-containing protein [Candidatus Binatia bacterium]|nr:DUF547 domain-containing protein [Candidatus Binatia bacterium]